MTPVSSRLVLHFAGFEPLNAEAHRLRFQRAGVKSAETYGYTLDCGQLDDFHPFPSFVVRAHGANWQTENRIVVFDHNDYISHLRSSGFAAQVGKGYLAAIQVVLEDGLAGYLRQAWRFALFFVFPFMLMAFAFVLAGLIMAIPVTVGLPLWHLVWSLPAGVLAFWRLFLPFAERYLTLHLFADWRMTMAVARQDDPLLQEWIKAAVARVSSLIGDHYDDIVITGHSMGASLAADVIGSLLKADPDVFNGKSVALVTLGGAILQVGLLKSARHLRDKVATLAQCPDLAWIEVQCLTDIVHFYKTRTVAACGYATLRQAQLLLIRFKHMLTADHYKKIKPDTLRVHRQYVLASDTRSAFDFTVLTTGPVSARHAANPDLSGCARLDANGGLSDF